jgi:hypothetical protein
MRFGAVGKGVSRDTSEIRENAFLCIRWPNVHGVSASVAAIMSAIAGPACLSPIAEKRMCSCLLVAPGLGCSAKAVLRPVFAAFSANTSGSHSCRLAKVAIPVHAPGRATQGNPLELLEQASMRALASFLKP